MTPDDLILLAFLIPGFIALWIITPCGRKGN